MLKIKMLLPLILLATPITSAFAHEIPWPRGMSRQVGFGTCAKGPCMKRTSSEASVPHKHAGKGKCIGRGAGGYPYGLRFDCLKVTRKPR